jgi:hypothetical protein
MISRQSAHTPPCPITRDGIASFFGSGETNPPIIRIAGDGLDYKTSSKGFFALGPRRKKSGARRYGFHVRHQTPVSL